MIGSLSGSATHKFDNSVLIEIGGVGYEIFLTAADWGSVSVGQPAHFFIYEQIREDAHNLYGFASLESRELFMQLLGVSGIGPKVALAILSAANISQLKAAIAAGNPDILKGVAGVGKKTAERIVVELRGKLGPAAAAPGAAPAADDDTYQALIGLGYTPSQASDAVLKIPAGTTGDQARIKAALKELAK